MASSLQPAPAGLLKALSNAPPKTCHAEPVDWESVLPQYTGCFALLIHDLLSPEECQSLLVAAEAAADNKWEGAMVNIGGGRQQLMTDVRLCDRILWDEPALTDKLMTRIYSHLPENIATLKDSAFITGNGPVRRKETWKITRANERLRFLKYTPGMYFREHCDGSYITPDGQEMSFLTIHIYLNGTDQEKGKLPLTGGATRFYRHNFVDYYDVNPRTGACLVFQHRNLLHSGEDVVTGTKYTLRTDIMYKKVDTST